MTRVEILYRYGMTPTNAVTFALAGIREVYGVRHFRFDRAARTLRVEYDATRLDAATVTNLVRGAGLEIVEVLPLAAPAPPAPEPASAS
ncbi:MAG: hypothetical protein WBE76_05530 [Terracidiphilus sp.]